jgi:spore coat protein U domain-containing protein, fimbrial subunit CupE1/2/3/6
MTAKRARKGFAAVVALVAVLSCADAAAATDCSVSAVGVAFGTYDTLASVPNDSTGSVTVICTYLSGGAGQVTYNAKLSTGSSGTYASRRLRAGAMSLNYNLFTDTARSVVWGDGLAGTSVASGSFTVGPGVGNGSRQDVRPVYGRIPARQDVLDGAYSDTIIVTLEF